MWLSLYIYFGDDLYGRDIDRLLVLAIAPLLERLQAEQLIERYFFVRYQDPECHLRLRLEVRPVMATEVENRVRSSLASFLEREAGNEASVSRIENVPYEPEWQRYGGLVGVTLAERHFHLSSTVAIEALSETLDGAASRRVGKSLLMALVLAQSFCGDFRAASSFLSWYADSYLAHMLDGDDAQQDFRRRLAANSRASEASVDRAVASLLTVGEQRSFGSPWLDRWAEGCRGLRREIRHLTSVSQLDIEIDLASLNASLLHMHHNRLGLSIPQEVHLTYLAASSLVRQEIR